MTDAEELPLGRGVGPGFRIGDRVRRPAGPWTPTVHAFLDHLERRGFRGAPRVHGVDAEGSELLTYIEGEVPNDSAWEPGDPNLWPKSLRGSETLAETAALIRELHEASHGFDPVNAVWREWEPVGLLPGEIVCHGDLGQHNTVYRDGMPVAFIDWDGAMPGLPILEFAAAAFPFVPLIEDRKGRNQGFPTPDEQTERFACYARAYGETDADKLLWALKEVVLRGTQKIRYWPLDAAGAAIALQHSVERLQWIATHGDRLVRDLRSGNRSPA